MSVTTASPATSLPKANASFDLALSNSSLSIISLRPTTDLFFLGISIPTVCFPGIGASILIDSASKLNAISSAKLEILLTLTPSAGAISNLVITGPTETFSTFAETPKLCKVFLNFSEVAKILFLISPSSVSPISANILIGGNS